MLFNSFIFIFLILIYFIFSAALPSMRATPPILPEKRQADVNTDLLNNHEQLNQTKLLGFSLNVASLYKVLRFPFLVLIRRSVNKDEHLRSFNIAAFLPPETNHLDYLTLVWILKEGQFHISP